MLSNQIKSYGIVVAIALAPMVAHAEPSDYDLALRSQIAWGPTISPDTVSLSTEGGWNGGDRRAVVSAAVEATLLPRLSLLTNATYGGLTDHARPAIGAAYQLLDPRTSSIGARLSLSYKPEGFTEPEGELESVLILSHQIPGGMVRGMLAYGQDPERNESDVEGGASLVQRVSPDLVIGGTFRYRRGLVIKTGEPSWDALGGVLGGMAIGRARVELMVGADGIKYSSAQWGIVGLVSIGTDL